MGEFMDALTESDASATDTPEREFSVGLSGEDRSVLTNPQFPVPGGGPPVDPKPFEMTPDKGKMIKDIALMVFTGGVGRAAVIAHRGGKAVTMGAKNADLIGEGIGAGVGLVASRSDIPYVGSGEIPLIGAARGEADPSEALQGINRAAKESALGLATAKPIESGMRLAGRALRNTPGLSRLVRPFQKLEEGAERAFDIGSRRGATPTVGQLGRNRTLDTVENIADAALFGRNFVRSTREDAGKALGNELDDFARMLGKELTDADMAVVVGEAVENGATVFKAMARAKYAAVDNAYVAANVSSKQMKELARLMLRERKRGIVTAQEKKLLNDMMSRGDTMTFAGAAELRSDLLAVARTSDEIITGRVQAAAKRLAGTLDKAMSDAIETAGPEAKVLWRSANQFWREGRKNFNSKFIRRMTNVDEQAVARAVIPSSGVVSAGTMNRLRSVMSRRQFANIQGTHAQRLMRNFTRTADQEVDGGRLLTWLNRRERSELVSVYGEDGLRNFQELAQALKISQINKPSGDDTGRIIVQMAQGTALGGAASALFFGFSDGKEGALNVGGVLLAPAAAAFLISRPSMSRFLVKGLNSTDARVASRAFGNFMVQAQKLEEMMGTSQVKILRSVPPEMKERLINGPPAAEGGQQQAPSVTLGPDSFRGLTGGFQQ